MLESDQLTSLGESSGVSSRGQFAGTEFCWSVLGRQIALWELRVGGLKVCTVVTNLPGGSKSSQSMEDNYKTEASPLPVILGENSDI